MRNSGARLSRTLIMTDKQHLLLNAVVFQGAWLICVLAGSVAAAAVTIVVVGLHLRWVRDRRRESIFLMQAFLIGLCCDLLLVQTGVLVTGSALPPLWLSCLWLLFGTTVGYALRPFHGRPGWCMAGGALLAPLSYFGGASLSAVALMSPVWLSLLIIAVIWTFIFPLLVHLYSVNRLRLPV
jgi:hypothetical protein